MVYYLSGGLSENFFAKVNNSLWQCSEKSRLLPNQTLNHLENSTTFAVRRTELKQ